MTIVAKTSTRVIKLTILRKFFVKIAIYKKFTETKIAPNNFSATAEKLMRANFLNCKLAIKPILCYNKDMKIFTYTVVFEKTQDGGYIAHVPVLPGCSTQGETFEEAKENAKDAIAGYIEVLQEDGDEIPVESEEHVAATVAVPMKV